MRTVEWQPVQLGTSRPKSSTPVLRVPQALQMKSKVRSNSTLRSARQDTGAPGAGGSVSAGTQSLDGGSLHDGARGGCAGPDLELAGGLFEKHLEAGDDLQALLGGAADQRCFDRVIDHVEDQVCGNRVGE